MVAKLYIDIHHAMYDMVTNVANQITLTEPRSSGSISNLERVVFMDRTYRMLLRSITY